MNHQLNTRFQGRSNPFSGPTKKWTRTRIHRGVALLLAGAISVSALPAPAATPTVSANQSFVSTNLFARDVAVSGSYLYWTNTWITPGSAPNTTIGRSNLDGTGVNQSFISGADTPSGIVVLGSFIYWTNTGTNSIGRSNLDGTGVNPSFVVGASTPDGLATDGTYLYWTNYTGNSIGRATLDGTTSVNQNFVATASGPYGVAVNATSIFWTVFGPGTGTTIGRSDISGANVNATLVTTLAGPTGITIQPSSGKLFWSNYFENSIGTANADGTSPNLNYVTGLHGPVGLEATADDLWWANYDTNKIGHTVFDHIAPVLSVPVVPPVIATTSGLNAVTYPTAVSATDATDVPADVTISCNVGTLTGGSFAMGSTTTVICTATDAVGNATMKSFNVTVNPPTPPVLTLSPNVNATATVLTGVTVTYAAPTSTTGTPTCSPASGTNFAIGTTTVSCEATDAVGQTTVGSFTVTVTKAGFPTIAAVSNITAVAAVPAGIAVSYTAPTASAGTPTCLPASGSVFALGPTTVTCSTTDLLNQTTTSTFTITVVKPPAPTITVPANIRRDADTASGAVVTYPNPSVSAGTATCVPPSGGNFGFGVTTVTCTTSPDVFGRTSSASFTIRIDPLPIVPVVVNPPANNPAITGPVVATPVAVVTASTSSTTTSTTTTTTTPAGSTAASSSTSKTTPSTSPVPTTTVVTVPTAAPASASVLPAVAVLGNPQFTG